MVDLVHGLLVTDERSIELSALVYATGGYAPSQLARAGGRPTTPSPMGTVVDTTCIV